MTGIVGTNVIKDGNGAAIVGGVRMFDISGAGTGPWVAMSILTDLTGAAVDPALASLVKQDDATASGAISTQNLSPTAAATANSAVEIDCSGKATLAIQVSANTLSQVLTIQATVDGTTWVSMAAQAISSLTTNSFQNIGTTIAAAATGIWRANVAGYSKARVSENAAVTGSATVALRASGTPSTTEIIGLPQISGQSGNGATAAGSPVGTGGLVVTAAPTAGTSGQRKEHMVNAYGAQVMLPFSVPELTWKTGSSPITLTTGSQALIAAAGAGLRRHLDMLRLTCGATWTANTVRVLDNATVIDELDIPAGAGVYSIEYPVSMFTTAATALNILAVNAVTGSCKASAYGHIAP